MLTPKTNSQWNQFLSLFIKMNFSRYACSHCSDFLSDDQVRKQSVMSKRGQKTTSNESYPTAKEKPCLVLRDRDQKSEEIFSQSLGSRVSLGYADEKKRSRKSNQATGAPRLKFRNRTSSSESTREFSLSKQTTVAGESQPSRKWWEKNILTPRAQGNLQLHHQNWKKNGIHEPWLHEQDISVFAEEIGNVCNQRNILNGRIQHKCIDMENVYHFVDESPPFILGRISSPNRTSNRTQNSTSEIGISQWSSEQMG